MLNKIPGIFIDIDGVLKLGSVPIPKAKEGIELLRKFKIPFTLVTNDGGDLESVKANKYTKILGLNKEYSFKENEVVLATTPMISVIKKDILNNRYNNKIPFVFGSGNIHRLMKCNGITKYITDIEYSAIYFYNMGFNTVAHLIPVKEKIKNEVSKRLNMDLNKQISISSIFQVSDVLRWELPLQICCDILISKNGLPGTIRSIDNKYQVPYHLSLDEIDYKDKFILPRYAGGAFFSSVQFLFDKMYKRKIQYQLYGKPSPKVFDYAINVINKKVNKIGKSLGNLYMIGDTPQTDIKGANNYERDGKGIYSILVRTGMFKGGINDKKNPAKKVVDNFYEAIRFILKKEKMI